MYKVENEDKEKAWTLAKEWNYNNITGKIPIGILYEV
jgi:hypothetical protein